MSSKGKLFFIVSILSLFSLIGLFFATQIWMPFMWLQLGFFLFFALGWLYFDRKLIFELSKLKTTRHGLNMGFLVIAMLIFLVTINFFGARHYFTYDFSSNNLNSLSDQSIKILSSLEEDLKFKFFYKNGADRAEENKKIFRELIKQYQDVSHKIQFEAVEMNEKPKLTSEFQANKGSGEAFADYKGHKNRIENYSEKDVTNSIIKLTRKEQKNIYFLQGHNERNIDDEKNETSLFGFRQMLEKNSFNVKKLTLVTDLKVPEDVHLLIIAGPTQQIQPLEIKAIEDYLYRGGNLLVMLDEKETYGLSDLLNKFGLVLEKHYVYNIFTSPMGKVVNTQAATVAVQYSSSSEITKVFTSNQMATFRNPHSLTIRDGISLLKTDVLVRSPESSVALAELDSKDYLGNERSFILGVEIKGKLDQEAKDFSAVVFSDVDFVSNILLYQNINRDLALNTISALTKETDLISISSKDPQISKLLVSPPEFNQFFKFIVVGLFFPLPFLFAVISTLLWYKRRHA